MEGVKKYHGLVAQKTEVLVDPCAGACLMGLLSITEGAITERSYFGQPVPSDRDWDVMLGKARLYVATLLVYCLLFFLGPPLDTCILVFIHFFQAFLIFFREFQNLT